MKKITIIMVSLLLLFGCKKSEITYQAEIIPNALTDADGNIYDAVRIGDQVWMAENMRVKSDIPSAPPYSNLDYPQYMYPDNDPNKEQTYGLLYSWGAAQEVCPEGWHLPDSVDWVKLVETVSSIDKNEKYGNIAAFLCGNMGWVEKHKKNAGGDIHASGRNCTGFNALPASSNGENFGKYAMFWSTYNNAWDSTLIFVNPLDQSQYHIRSNEPTGYFLISYESAYTPVVMFDNLNGFYSVRCIRD